MLKMTTIQSIVNKQQLLSTYNNIIQYLSKALMGNFFHGMLCLSMSLEKEGRLKRDCRMAFM